ncbi:MAG: class I SAM-dependent methyltransferase [Candidatus Omnitrophica bacterium]|nr:class I SAM-dependent methyltransferase [Candidatus Omnitrophota bacterium]
MERVITENYKRYCERISLYRKFGYDIEKERAFIIEKAQPLYGDILEVGTGKGYLTVALAKEGYHFTSIDISEDEQRFARLNIEYFGFEKQVDFNIENAESLSFKNGSFDVISSINTVDYFMNLFKVIDELIRIVSFEGKIILSDFSKEGLELVDKIHSSEGKRHKANQINLDDIAKYLLDKDFRIEKHGSRFQEILIAYHQLI